MKQDQLSFSGKDDKPRRSIVPLSGRNASIETSISFISSVLSNVNHLIFPPVDLNTLMQEFPPERHERLQQILNDFDKQTQDPEGNQYLSEEIRNAVKERFLKAAWNHSGGNPLKWPFKPLYDASGNKIPKFTHLFLDHCNEQERTEYFREIPPNPFKPLFEQKDTEILQQIPMMKNVGSILSALPNDLKDYIEKEFEKIDSQKILQNQKQAKKLALITMAVSSIPTMTHEKELINIPDEKPTSDNILYKEPPSNLAPLAIQDYGDEIIWALVKYEQSIILTQQISSRQ